MTFDILIHLAEEGGYWAEVPSLAGCATQGDTFDDLMANLREAVAGWLDVGEAEVELRS